MKEGVGASVEWKKVSHAVCERLPASHTAAPLCTTIPSELGSRSTPLSGCLRLKSAILVFPSILSIQRDAPSPRRKDGLGDEGKGSR